MLSPPPRAMPEVAVRLEATNGLSVYGEGPGRHGVNRTILVYAASDLWRG